VVDELPLTGDAGRTLVGTTRADAAAEAVTRVAGPSYFRVMGIPIAAGRELDSRDGASSPQRVVISERLATRLFGPSAAVDGAPLNDLTSAIGRTVYLAGPRQTFELVGVAGDVTHRALDEVPLETVYLSAWQQPSRSSHIVVRSDRKAGDVVAIVRSEVARLDRDLPVYAIRSMDDVIAASAGVPTRRVLMNTFTAFAVLAVLLSAVGLFGIVAHEIASRRSELALRLALGAHPLGLLIATLRKGLALTAGGVAAGFVLSVWSARALANLAPAIDRLDVASTVAAAAILLAVGTGAVLPAARRAARTDPLLALRSE
jgi:putative ABC transport system permease protein